MARDWSDPEANARELARRERAAEAPGNGRLDDAPALAEELRAALARLEAETASQTEDLASLRALLARREETDPDPDSPPPPETGLARRLAEAEGRLTAHLERLAERAGEAALEETLAPLADQVRGHTLENRARVAFLDQLSVTLKDMVRDAELGLVGRFEREARSVRETLEARTVTVHTPSPRSRRFRLALAGAAVLCLLAAFAGGVWLQWRHAPVPVADPTLGWRDYLWHEYGDALIACERKARESGRAVQCPVSTRAP